jgi:hypothetical protein
MSQSWVAAQLELHQSTVSRIVQRYERWIARGGPAREGALSHAERVRYQRYMTYERNEVFLASAIRLAEEMERALDTTKSTTQYAQHSPSQETRVRTEHLVIDRSGAACRYLRLAFRINMEQQKLVEQDDLDPLDPLAEDNFDPASDDELNRPAQTQARSASKGSALSILEDSSIPADQVDVGNALCGVPSGPRSNGPPGEAREGEAPAEPSAMKAPGPSTSVLERSSDPSTRPTERLPATNHDQSVNVVELTPHAAPTHTIHTSQTQKSPLNPDSTISCYEIAASEKHRDNAYPVASTPPEIAAFVNSFPLPQPATGTPPIPHLE